MESEEREYFHKLCNSGNAICIGALVLYVKKIIM